MKETLYTWMETQVRYTEIREESERIEKEFEAAGKAHRERWPLTKKMKDAIYGAFAEGRPLCCKEGRKVLKELGVDSCWREYINDWAYNSLGCTESDKPGGCFYERYLENLRVFLYGGKRT